MKRLLLIVLSVLLLNVSAASWADSFEEGFAAHEQGDYATALQIYRTLAAQGDARGQYYLGVMYGNGQGVAKDGAEEIKWYQIAAAQGYALAQFNLGLIYDFRAKDETEWVKWSKLEETGNAEAGPKLELILEHRVKDGKEAVRWYRLAAEHGDTRSALILAHKYATGGPGVARDDTEAFRWLRLAAMQGSAYAQVSLGMQYLAGQGVTQDYEEAIKWFRLAAAQGDTSAQVDLGRMYESGQGVTRNYERAHMWFNISGALGSASGVKYRDLLAMKMTSEQISTAQKMARECQQRDLKGCD